ncbi:MAG: hypothetical protein Q8P72_04080 [Candidatus Roizmanbacteria bacterium]|nr:hypothetical protein [Candidatus Roizmanbacteria bacterium]
MIKKPSHKILIYILLSALLLIIPISNMLLSKRQTTKTRAESTSNFIKLKLTTDTNSEEINKPLTIAVRAAIDNSSQTLSILAYAVGIKIPKPLIVNSPLVFNAPFIFTNSEIVDKGTYYEIQFIAANKQSEPYILQNDTKLASFTVTSSSPVTTSIEFVKRLSYPSIIDSEGTEKLGQTSLTGITVSILALTPTNIPTLSPTITPTPTPTMTFTVTPTKTPLPTQTPTMTPTLTPTPPSISATPTPTPTLTPTNTPISTATIAPILTYTPTPNIDSCPNFSKGNANCDPEGKVNLIDFICWRYEYINNKVAASCGGGEHKRADFNQDNTVTLFDFAIWLATFKEKL